VGSNPTRGVETEMFHLYTEGWPSPVYGANLENLRVLKLRGFKSHIFLSALIAKW